MHLVYSLEIFDDPERLQKLHLEIAAVIDAAVHFVNAIYYLEGDGPLIFSCYEHLSAVAHATAVSHYPNIDAVARENANSDAALCNHLRAQAKPCVRPGLNFYQQKFSVKLHNTVRGFKVTRLCCPVQIQALCPTAATLEELRHFPFANDAMIANLTVTGDDDKLSWCAAHRQTLPFWSAIVTQLLLIHPSSAAAERVFSLLYSAFHFQ